MYNNKRLTDELKTYESIATWFRLYYNTNTNLTNRHILYSSPSYINNYTTDWYTALRVTLI